MEICSTLDSYWIETDEWHTAGESFRIVPILPPHCLTTGTTVAERKENIVNTPGHPVDELRRILCHEPRGHADMYGIFLVPPNDSSAHLGVLFFHNDGFSTACGHGTIALGYWAIAKGLVGHPPNDVVIDVPSGRVVAQMMLENGSIKHADFSNVPSYMLAKAVPVTLQSIGLKATIELAWGGAVYAFLDVKALNLVVDDPLRVTKVPAYNRPY